MTHVTIVPTREAFILRVGFGDVCSLVIARHTEP